MTLKEINKEMLEICNKADWTDLEILSPKQQKEKDRLIFLIQEANKLTSDQREDGSPLNQ